MITISPDIFDSCTYEGSHLVLKLAFQLNFELTPYRIQIDGQILSIIYLDYDFSNHTFYKIRCL
jgi:hypothetical protein